MEKSKVFFSDLRTAPGVSLLDKMERLVKRAGIENIDFDNKFVAIKIHFGEPGNMAYLRPQYAARLVAFIKSKGGKPFLTDCNTLYSGGRHNAVDHLEAARKNGYNPLVTDCDCIIADGVKGSDYVAVPIEGATYCHSPKIGRALVDADIVISMTHFKGHEQAGFGGTLKNLGMGGGSVEGKLEMHSNAQPEVDRDNCRGCGSCARHCAHDAIHLDSEHKAVIDYEKCVGCGQCIAMCQFGAAVQGSYTTGKELNWKIAEYTKAVLQDKPSFHISFIMNVSPECDCWGSNDAAIVPDLGMAASFDPIALDRACADMVVAAPVLPGSHLAETHPSEDLCGADKFHLGHPDTCWQEALEHGEAIGLGSQSYELVRI